MALFVARKFGQMILEKRVCLSCQGQFHGRSDKKFCNDYCRNTHHNRLNSDNNHYIRSINHCLRRNMRLLEEALKPGRVMARVSKESLLIRGFHFHFHTHCQSNNKGTVFYYCYEYGYCLTNDGSVMIVKKNSGKMNLPLPDGSVSI